MVNRGHTHASRIDGHTALQHRPHRSKRRNTIPDTSRLRHPRARVDDRRKLCRLTRQFNLSQHPQMVPPECAGTHHRYAQPASRADPLVNHHIYFDLPKDAVGSASTGPSTASRHRP